jgi:hypothetical protein
MSEKARIKNQSVGWKLKHVRSHHGFKLRHDLAIGLNVFCKNRLKVPRLNWLINNLSDQLSTEVIRLLFMPTTATSSLTEAEYSQEIFNDMKWSRKIKNARKD